MIREALAKVVQGIDLQEEEMTGTMTEIMEGKATPADARLISAELLRIDVSSLTGESRPIPRTVESVGVAPDAGAATLSNLVFAGTTVALFVGLAGEFTESFREMNVIEAASKMPRRLTDVL